jgi:hypothetical protein
VASVGAGAEVRGRPLYYRSPGRFRFVAFVQFAMERTGKPPSNGGLDPRPPRNPSPTNRAFTGAGRSFGTLSRTKIPLSRSDGKPGLARSLSVGGFTSDRLDHHLVWPHDVMSISTALVASNLAVSTPAFPTTQNRTPVQTSDLYGALRADVRTPSLPRIIPAIIPHLRTPSREPRTDRGIQGRSSAGFPQDHSRQLGYGLRLTDMTCCFPYPRFLRP